MAIFIKSLALAFVSSNWQSTGVRRLDPSRCWFMLRPLDDDWQQLVIHFQKQRSAKWSILAEWAALTRLVARLHSCCLSLPNGHQQSILAKSTPVVACHSFDVKWGDFSLICRPHFQSCWSCRWTPTTVWCHWSHSKSCHRLISSVWKLFLPTNTHQTNNN